MKNNFIPYDVARGTYNFKPKSFCHKYYLLPTKTLLKPFVQDIEYHIARSEKKYFLTSYFFSTGEKYYEKY